MRKIVLIISVVFLAACSDAVESSDVAIARAQELCQNFGGVQSMYTQRPHSREVTRVSVATCMNGVSITFVTKP